MDTCTECGEVLGMISSPLGDQYPLCPRCGSNRRTASRSGVAVVYTTAVAVGSTLIAPLSPDIPALLLNAVVTLGLKSADGSSILAVEPVWNQISKLIASDPGALFKIPPDKMEQMIAGWYASLGYDVTLTPRSGDYGRDVIAEKPGILSVRIIDQVKAYKPGHLVDANDVRALWSLQPTLKARSATADDWCRRAGPAAPDWATGPITGSVRYPPTTAPGIPRGGVCLRYARRGRPIRSR